MTKAQILSALGIEDSNLGGYHGEWMGSGAVLDVTSPIDGERIASVAQDACRSRGIHIDR